MPRPVIEAIHRHIDLEATLGGYEAAAKAEQEIDTAYASVATLLGASPRNVAFVSSATAAFVQALSAFDFAPGDTIVTTRADYTSYQIQLLSLAKRRGVTVVHAADRPGGGVDPDSVRDILGRSRCRLVTVSWIPTHSGLVQDVEAVGKVCEEAGVPYHVDACQVVGQFPIDVQRLRCDYLSGTARKFLRGPRGIGFLFVSDRALDRGDCPLFVDMRGATWVGPDSFDVQPTARRFEEWESPYALVLGLGAAADYALKVGANVARDRSAMLAALLRGLLSAVPGVQVLDPGPPWSALITAELAGRHAKDVAAALFQRGVNTSVTLQWYGLRDLGPRNIESALRLSPHYYNTEAEVAEVVGFLTDILRKS
jgi:selenocysteine lyase/cysteine desulfurase